VNCEGCYIPLQHKYTDWPEDSKTPQNTPKNIANAGAAMG